MPSLRRLFCFWPHKSPEPLDPTPNNTHNVIRLRSIRKAAVESRVAVSRITEPASIRPVLEVTCRPTSRPNSLSTDDTSDETSTFASDTDSQITASSATTHEDPSSSEGLAKSPATLWQGDAASYVSILQTDGALQPPHISFDGYGAFGGRFVPESIIGFLNELGSVFEATVSDPSFWSEFANYQLTEPTQLYRANNLTALAGGATIWLKREDQNEYGSHKTRNIIGQLLIARRMGRSEIVTDCASAKHGNFTAAVCARLGLRCVVVMGADDAQTQQEDVLEMKMLGAKVITARAPSGMGSLRAAITEALRYSVCNHESAYYLMGGPVGPNPLPTLTRTFQALLGEEVAVQMNRAVGRQPDAVVTAIGSGSGAVGMFRPFLHLDTRLVGVEAVEAATLTRGEVGVLQGARTLMLQDDDGQILDSHSISPDLNLSTVGPEVAHWKDSGRVQILTATDADALDGFKTLHQHEGIPAGLDSSHAVGKTMQVAKELGPGKNVVLLVTGCDSIGGQVLDT